MSVKHSNLLSLLSQGQGTVIVGGPQETFSEIDIVIDGHPILEIRSQYPGTFDDETFKQQKERFQKFLEQLSSEDFKTKPAIIEIDSLTELRDDVLTYQTIGGNYNKLKKKTPKPKPYYRQFEKGKF